MPNRSDCRGFLRTIAVDDHFQVARKARKRCRSVRGMSEHGAGDHAIFSAEIDRPDIDDNRRFTPVDHLRELSGRNPGHPELTDEELSLPPASEHVYRKRDEDQNEAHSAEMGKRLNEHEDRRVEQNAQENGQADEERLADAVQRDESDDRHVCNASERGGYESDARHDLAHDER